MGRLQTCSGTGRLAIAEFSGRAASCCDAGNLLGCCFGQVMNEIRIYPFELIGDPNVGYFSSNRTRLGDTSILTDACVYVDGRFGVVSNGISIGIDPAVPGVPGIVAVPSPYPSLAPGMIFAERREMRGGGCGRYLVAGFSSQRGPRNGFNVRPDIPPDAEDDFGNVNSDYAQTFGAPGGPNPFGVHYQFRAEQQTAFTFVRSLVESQPDGSGGSRKVPIRRCSMKGTLGFRAAYQVFPGEIYGDDQDEFDQGEFLLREREGVEAPGMPVLIVEIEVAPFEIAFGADGRPAFRDTDNAPGGALPTADGRMNAILRMNVSGGAVGPAEPPGASNERYAASVSPSELPDGVSRLVVDDTSTHDILDARIYSTDPILGPEFGTLDTSNSGDDEIDPSLGLQRPFDLGTIDVRLTSDSPLFDCGCLTPEGETWPESQLPAGCPALVYNETECDGVFDFYDGTPLDPDFDGTGPIPRPDPIPPDGDGGGGGGGGPGSAPNCPDPEEIDSFEDLLDVDPRCWPLYFPDGGPPGRIPFPIEPLAAGEQRKGRRTRRSLRLRAKPGARSTIAGPGYVAPQYRRRIQIHTPTAFKGVRSAPQSQTGISDDQVIGSNFRGGCCG